MKPQRGRAAASPPAPPSLPWALWLAQASAAHPRLALGLMLALVSAMAPGLWRIQLRTDGHSLVPPHDPAVTVDRQARQVFGLRDPLLVAIETPTPNGIFDPHTLQRLQALTHDLAALPGIGPDHVVSLATEKSRRFAADGFNFLPLLEPLPWTPARRRQLQEEVQAVDTFRGTLISFDGRAAAVLVGVPAPGQLVDGHAVDRVRLYHQVAAIAQRYQHASVRQAANDAAAPLPAAVTPDHRAQGSALSGGAQGGTTGDRQQGGQAANRPVGERIWVVGAPAAEALLGEHVLADLALLLPLALITIATVLWVACGRTWGAAIGLAKVAGVQVFTLGLIGWSGQPVYLTTAVIPVLLTTVGLSDEIHLLWHYRHRPAGQPPAVALARALQDRVPPIVLTSLATAIGFLSFLASSIPAVWSFGLFAGIGVLFCILWALVATPALMALRPDAIPAAGPAAADLRRVHAALARLAQPRTALPALAIATILLVAGIPRLVVQDGWIDNFAPDSPLRRASARIDQLFAGTHQLLAVLTFDPPAAQVPAVPAARGPLLAGSTLAAVGRFEQALRAQPQVGGVLGPAGYLTTTAYLWAGMRPESRAIIDDPAWIYLHFCRIGTVRGMARRRELIDAGFRRTVVTLLLKRANYQETAALIATIRQLEKTQLAPVYGRVDLAGDVAVSQAMIPAIVHTQLASLALALAGSLAVVMLIFRSARMGLAAVAPTALAVAWTFGLMGWLAIPLGVATSIFCAVTLGIGVDFGIHLFHQLRRAQAAGEPQPGAAALAAAGPAILIDAAAITLGFGLLAFSRVPANSRFGLLVAAGLSSACLLTLAGAGAGLLLRDRRYQPAPLPAPHPPPLADRAIPAKP